MGSVRVGRAMEGRTIGMLVIQFGVGEAEGETLGLVRFDLVGELAAGNTTSEVMPVGFVVSLVAVAAFCLWRTARSWNHKVALG